MLGLDVLEWTNGSNVTHFWIHVLPNGDKYEVEKASLPL